MANEAKAVSVIVGLGANLGDRHENMGRALDLLRELAGVRLLRVSRLRETDPVGGPPQGKYLNAVAEVETVIAPRELLDRFHEIEADLGRQFDLWTIQRPISISRELTRPAAPSALSARSRHSAAIRRAVSRP